MAGKSAATPAAWWDVKTRVGKQMHTLIGESFYCTCGFVSLAVFFFQKCYNVYTIAKAKINLCTRQF